MRYPRKQPDARKCQVRLNAYSQSPEPAVTPAKAHSARLSGAGPIVGSFGRTFFTNSLTSLSVKHKPNIPQNWSNSVTNYPTQPTNTCHHATPAGRELIYDTAKSYCYHVLHVKCVTKPVITDEISPYSECVVKQNNNVDDAQLRFVFSGCPKSRRVKRK
jgi:hypothetical protein